jgi:methionine biosynthesis protein MetW
MNVREYYEGQARIKDTGAEVDGRVRTVARLFQRHLGRAERLLDIGCGVGAVGLYLGHLLSVREVFGVEISERRAGAARGRGIQVVLCHIDQGLLPFEDGKFDAIFCGEIIEHLVDPDHLLDEIGRLLAPGGMCVLTTPNLACWYNRIALLLGWQPFDTSVSFRHEVGRPQFLVGGYGCRDHLRVFTFRALRDLLTVRGFRIVECQGCNLTDVIIPSVDADSPRIREVLYSILRPLDLMFGRSPHLGTRVVVAFGKSTGG